MSNAVLFFLFVICALVQVVIGFRDSCNCLLLSGYLHICFVIDLAALNVRYSYDSVVNAPNGFQRFHMLLQLANLLFMIFMCLDCAVETVLDYRKVNDLNPTTMVIILIVNLVLYLLAMGCREENLTNATRVPVFKGINIEETPSLWSFSQSITTESLIPVQVGPIGFLCYAVLWYVQPGSIIYWIDPFVTFLSIVAVLARSWSILRNYTLFFMQSNSNLQRGIAAACLQKIESLPGVIEYVRVPISLFL